MLAVNQKPGGLRGVVEVVVFRSERWKGTSKLYKMNLWNLNGYGWQFFTKS